MFLVTAFMSGKVIETIATRHELHERFNWCEDENPLLECESIAKEGIVALTITIRPATHEDLVRLRVQ